MSYVKDVSAITDTSHSVSTSNSTLTYIAVIVSILLFITIISLGFMWLDERNKSRMAEFEIKMLEHLNHYTAQNPQTQHSPHPLKQPPLPPQNQNNTPVNITP